MLTQMAKALVFNVAPNMLMFFSLACANQVHVCSEVVHLSNGNQVFHFQINMVHNISIKRGRNIAVVKGSVVNALEAEIPRLSLPDRLSELT